MREEHLAGKPAPDSFLRGAELLGVAAGPGRGLRGRAVRRDGRPGRRLRLRRRRRPGRARRGAAPARRRRRRRGPGRAAVSAPMISEDAFPVEPWHAARDPPRPRPAGPVRVAVRPLQRAHRPARQPRRGRAVRAPGHLPRAPSTRRARCRTPRPATAIPRTGRRCRRHQRQAHPAAGRRRAVRRPVRRAARPRAGAGPAGGHAARGTATGAPRPGTQVKVRSTRLVSFAQRGVAAIEYVVEAVDQFTRVTVQSELVANEDAAGAVRATRGSSAVLDQPAGGGAARATPSAARCCCTGPGPASC